MKGNAKSTAEVATIEENQSMMESGNETLQSVSLVLKETYDSASDLPENSLIGHALRLNNLSHSLFEEREKNYVENTGDENTRKIDGEDLHAICAISAQARENIKLAMDIKKDKAKIVVDLITALKQ